LSVYQSLDISIFFVLILVLILYPFEVFAQESDQHEKSEKSVASDSELSKKEEKKNLNFFFPPSKHNVKFSDFEFDYDLSDPNQLKIGPFTYRTYTISMIWLEKGDRLILNWPEQLIDEGTIHLFSYSNEELIHSYSFNKEDLDDWKEERQKIASENSSGELSIVNYIKNSTIELPKISASILLKLNSPFKICISPKGSMDGNLFCTSKLQASQKAESSSLIRKINEIVANFPPEIFINKKSAPLKDKLKLQPKGKLSLQARINSGAVVEMNFEVPEVNIYDIYQKEDKNLFLRGVEPVPLWSEIIKNTNQTNSIWNKIKWQQTIGDFRQKWQMTLAPDTPYLYFKGIGGGILKLRFETDNIPLVRDFLTLNENALTSNGDESLWLKFNAPSNLQLNAPNTNLIPMKDNHNLLSSKDPQLEKVSPSQLEPATSTSHEPSDNEYLWKFETPNLYEYNTNFIEIKTKNKITYAGWSIYKNLPHEFSGRFSVISSDFKNLILLNEYLLNLWPQDIFDSPNYYFSQQRWGLSIKYFQETSHIRTQEDLENQVPDVKLSNTTLDLKYRFTPGLWGREETWGTILGFQNVQISHTSVLMNGIGFFWARSMPKLFDDIMSYLPFMDFPKFVDMEYIAYINSLTKDVALSSNFAINFHGKIFWHRSFFGEAGFGLKKYEYLMTKEELSVNLNSLYFTMGLGFNF